MSYLVELDAEQLSELRGVAALLADRLPILAALDDAVWVERLYGWSLDLTPFHPDCPQVIQPVRGHEGRLGPIYRVTQ